MADVAFTAYPFAATGAPTLRTLPARLADAANVRDFGAVGDGVTDDWRAIMAAIEKNSVDLTVAVTSPFIPDDAIRATQATTISGGSVVTLTASAAGTNYVPGRSYKISFSGGGSAPGKVLPTGHAVADGSGLINTAQLILDTAGSNLTTPPTGTCEYPGFNTTLTFTSVPADLAQYHSHTYNRSVTGDRIDNLTPGCRLISINVAAKTVTLIGRNEGSIRAFANEPVVRNSDIVPGDVVRFCRENVGLVFFPPGTYKVSRPVILDGGGRSFHLLGVGKASTITGNFDDFVLKRQLSPSSTATGGTRQIEKLCVENTHATGGGIRLGNCVGGAVHDCTVIANKGINTFNQDDLVGGAPWGSFEMIVSNNTLTTGGNRAGSIALALFHDGPTLNNYIVDFAKGWIHIGGQGGQIVAGNHFELCDIGCQQGITPSGAIWGTLGHAIVGNRFLNCGIACVNPTSLFAGNSIEAARGTISGDPQYGINVGPGRAANTLIAANFIEGWYAAAGFFFTGTDANVRRNTIVSNRATNTNGAATYGAWRTPVTPTTGTFIENNAAVTYLFANLPSNTTTNRLETQTYNITNSNTAAFGTIAAGGGANHIKVRVNAAKDYIVIGK